MSIFLISELCEYANMMENEKTKFCKTKKVFQDFILILQIFVNLIHFGESGNYNKWKHLAAIWRSKHHDLKLFEIEYLYLEIKTYFG